MTSIAIVVLDTLRKDTFDKHFQWVPGRRFEQAYSTSHWTVPAHASLFTGLYASEAGIHAGQQIMTYKDDNLAELLQEAGYTTRGISANVNVSSIYDFDRGFDEFQSVGQHYHRMRQITDPNLFDWTEAIGGGTLGYIDAVLECIQSDVDTIRSLREAVEMKLKLGPSDSSDDMGAERIRQWLSETDFGDREFLFVNLMETHGPYKIPEEYRSISEYQTPENPLGRIESDIDLSPFRTIYDESASYLSDQYRAMYDDLQESFDVIITLSDHGELLGEHGQCGHGGGLFPELTHIPLSIHSNGLSGTNSTPVSLVDVFATVLSAAGVSNDTRRGHSLIEESIPKRDLLTEYHGIPHPDRMVPEYISWIGDEDEVERLFQEWKRGLVAPDGTYAYETNEGIEIIGSDIDNDFEERIREKTAELTVSEASDDMTAEVSKSVKEELAHLGYVE